MSDPIGTTTPAVPAAPPPAAVAAPVPPLVAAVHAAAPPATPATNEEPHWLGARLDRERRAILADLGVENVADAKTAIAELKTKRDAEKTAAERAVEATARANTATAETAALKTAVGEFAARQMMVLTAPQLAAVKAIAGDDPAQQLKAIAALQPTWATAATVDAAAIAPAAPAAPATSTDTAPGPNAPPPVTSSPTDHRAQYEALRKTNPFAAATYGAAHPTEIFGAGG